MVFSKADIRKSVCVLDFRESAALTRDFVRHWMLSTGRHPLFFYSPPSNLYYIFHRSTSHDCALSFSLDYRFVSVHNTHSTTIDNVCFVVISFINTIYNRTNRLMEISRQIDEEPKRKMFPIHVFPHRRLFIETTIDPALAHTLRTHYNIHNYYRRISFIMPTPFIVTEAHCIESIRHRHLSHPTQLIIQWA